MKRRNGFTLVELLAVIVILAIILVIAVPQIMSTIEDATKASLESSAMMVAAQVETQYTLAQTLNKSEEDFNRTTGDCMQTWAGLNESDYTSCTYKIGAGGAVTVDLVGKNKFAGLYVCGASRTEATAQDTACPTS